jgi:peptidoglycan/xylan/chitin deacetylase (PgdA/CDA1 family)
VLDFDQLEARRAVRRRRRMLRRRRRRALGGVALAALIAGVALGAAAHHAPAARPVAQTRPRLHGTTARHGIPRPPRTGAGRDATVPILMYHVIAAPPAGAPFPALYVTPTLFAEQMNALHRAGWTAVTMDELWDAWTGRARLPAGRPVVISFDNGYSSHYNAAFPVLRHLHWPGVENLQLTGLPRSQGGLSHKALRRLLAAGWELDTQGESHADLVVLDHAALRHEVVDARRALQRHYGVPVHWFCFPSGHYDARVIAMVRAAGFRGATTVVPGWATRTDDPTGCRGCGCSAARRPASSWPRSPRPATTSPRRPRTAPDETPHVAAASPAAGPFRPTARLVLDVL